MELYSVLMSLYIKEKPEYLKLAVDSIINQTIKPDEIVIVEDGPLTEALYDQVDKYKLAYPQLFTIIKNSKNMGLGLALNQGLSYCRNELVARMDTDDISKPKRCEKQLECFRRNTELVIVGTYVDEFQDEITNIKSTRKVPCTSREIYEFGKRRSPFNHPSVMYKKNKVLDIGGYANLRRNQDVDLFGRMLFKGYKAENINDALVYFRLNESLVHRRRSWENSDSYIKTIRRFWKMGYSDLLDYAIVMVAQIGVFLCPNKVQILLYKLILRN